MRSSGCALTFACLLLASARPAPASTFTVAQDGSGDFTSVAAACEAAAAGDSVLIRPGEYREEEHDDPMDPAIALTEKPVSIVGDGPAESVSLQMKFGFVDCDGVLLTNVRLHHASGAVTIWGGSYLIQSCRFESNMGVNYGGGGVLCYWGSTVIEDCVFERNEAPDWGGWGGEGGAVFGGTDLTLRRCIFQGNRAALKGGAVCQEARLTVEDCFFIGNAAPHGSAVVIGEGSVTRSTFYRNDCLGDVGGAIAIVGDHAGMIPDHCIISETAGAGIECPMPASAQCCDLWMNQLDHDPWCGFETRYGNFSEDPLFCDPEGGDFGLLENSPCLPGNHGGYECGRIGAGVDYCGIIRTSETTWGRLKTMWR